MNKKEATEIADKIRDIMQAYPDLIYSLIICDESNMSVSSNYCIRCIEERLGQFIEENDIKHDSEYDSIEDIVNNANDETKH